MNYLAELRAFDEWLETNELSSSSIALWFALMQIANKTGWKSSFNVSIAVLEHKSGLDRRTVYRARNTLKQHGLISFRDRGANRSSEYSMMSVCQYDTQCDTHSVTQSVTQCVTQSVTQCDNIPKQDQTKPNETIKSKEKAAAFTRPTEADIVEYCKEAGITVNAQAFLDYYDSNGWKVGSSKMKDWKATARGWARRDAERKQGSKKGMGANAPYKQTQLSDEELDALLINLDDDLEAL